MGRLFLEKRSMGRCEPLVEVKIHWRIKHLNDIKLTLQTQMLKLPTQPGLRPVAVTWASTFSSVLFPIVGRAIRFRLRLRVDLGLQIFATVLLSIAGSVRKLTRFLRAGLLALFEARMGEGPA